MNNILKSLLFAIVAIGLSSCMSAGKKGGQGILYKYGRKIATLVGKDVTKDEMDNAESMCLELNPDIDVELIDGKQDIYSYIIAVE